MQVIVYLMAHLLKVKLLVLDPSFSLQLSGKD